MRLVSKTWINDSITLATLVRLFLDKTFDRVCWIVMKKSFHDTRHPTTRQ